MKLGGLVGICDLHMGFESPGREILGSRVIRGQSFENRTFGPGYGSDGWELSYEISHGGSCRRGASSGRNRKSISLSVPEIRAVAFFCFLTIFEADYLRR